MILLLFENTVNVPNNFFPKDIGLLKRFIVTHEK